MPTTITLTLPDDLVEQAQTDAYQVGKPLQETLVAVLRQAYPPVALHPLHAQMQQEVLAFQTLHPHLVNTHLGEFVAIKAGQLVDHDPDFDTLIDRVRETYGDEAIVMVDQVLPALPPEIRLRSPRLIQGGYDE
jgi:hypothetical protein